MDKLKFQIQEFDDFFPPYIASEIRNYILSKSILWEFHNEISYNKNVYGNLIKNFDDHLNVKDASAFTYLIEDKNNEMHQKIQNYFKHFIMKKSGIKVKKTIRSMLVFTPPDPLYPDNHILSPHVDWLDISGYHNFLYYINDSDGPTLFFDKKHEVGQSFTVENIKVHKSIVPKQNRAVIWEGSIYHAAGISKVQKRLTLNINYIPS